MELKGVVHLTEIPNTSIKAYFGTEEIIPEKDGYLGKIEAGEVLILVETTSNFISAFTTNFEKNITNLENLSSDYDSQTFLRVIRVIKHNESGHHITVYPQNNIRLLVLGESGAFEIWEAAIISQNGHFFLTIEKNYNASFFANANKEIVCPYFEEIWPQFCQYLQKELWDKQVNMRREWQYIPQNTKKELPTQNGIALVDWWSSAQGFGLAHTKEGVARVHWSQIKPSDARRIGLKPDQEIFFNFISQPENTKRDTEFDFEIFGVTIIKH